MFLYYLLLLNCFIYTYQFQKTSENYDLVDKYTIELLVVIDPLVRNVKLLPGMDHKFYILQKIKQAGEVFHHYDIGNHVELSVYQVIVAHIDTGYRRDVSVVDTFCEWVNRVFSMNRQFDYALYFTTNMERNMSFGEYNMCESKIQCGVINFNYIPIQDLLHLTVAHELGHSLNVAHDDDEKCNIRHGKNRFVMMSTYNGKQWSKCSKKQIESYLKSPYSNCLHNEPELNLLESMKLDAYTKAIPRNQICQYLYGPQYIASENRNSCTSLSCSNSILKYTWSSLQLNGIECGHSVICMDGKCTSNWELSPVHGGWTNWIKKSSCSLSCGGGVRLTKRYCTNPPPKYGGKYCSGKSTMYEMCNLHSCGQGNLTAIRDWQCDNGKSIYVPDKPCALYCENSTKLRVADGTPCYHNLTGKCLGGNCRRSDCQNVIYGQAVVDLCGVCNGGNRNCYLHKMSPISVPQVYGYTYRESSVDVHLITKVPKGSANILIEMEYNDQQHANLALRTSQSDFVPNGLRTSMYQTDFQLADYTFQFKYSNNRTYQMIKSIVPMGSTTQNIEVYVLDYFYNGVQSISYQWYNGNPKTN